MASGLDNDLTLRPVHPLPAGVSVDRINTLAALVTEAGLDLAEIALNLSGIDPGGERDLLLVAETLADTAKRLRLRGAS